MYNLTKTINIAVLTGVFILIPQNSYSLGIGDIKLHSALNQNFKAEIDLLDSSNEDLSNIRVSLAAPEKFDEAGIPWSYFLKQLKFKPVKRANGSIFIDVSSNAPLKELFLNFIVEVNWNKSSFLSREFTLLLDPPANYNLAVIPTTHQAIQLAEAEPKSERSVDRIVKHVTKKHRTQYGPTKPSDFLWKIAKRIRHKGVSVEQMAMALFKNNPNAFYKDNINTLKVRKMLNIPEKETALEMSRTDALAIITQHDNEWKEHLITKAPLTALAADTQTESAKTKSAKTLASNAKNDSSEKQLSVISSAEGLALLAKLDKLERKLEMLQSLLASKDKQAITNPAANQAALDSRTEVKEKPFVSQAEGMVFFTKKEALEQKLEMMQKMSALKDELDTILQEQQKSADLVPINSAAKPVETEQTLSVNPNDPTLADVETAPTPQAIAVKQNSEENTMPWLYEVIAGILLAILGYFGWTKRKNKKITEIEDVPDETTTEYQEQDDFKIHLPNSTLQQEIIGKDKGFLPTEVDDIFDSVHQQVDISVEADFYLGYGLYEKAKALIQHAINFYPERDEFKLKLLEIFYLSQNKTAFEVYMRDLVGIGKNNNPGFWAKVTQMHEKLCLELSPDQGKESQQAMIDDDKQFEIDGIDSLEIYDHKQPKDNIDPPSDNATPFDLSQFDEDENFEIADLFKKKTRPAQNNQIIENNNAAFGLSASGDTEDFSIDELNDKDSQTQDNQIAAGNEIAFDLPEFGDAEDFSIDELNDKDSQTQDNQIAAGNEIAFDLPEFGDAEDFSIDELTDKDSQTQDNQIAAGNEIAFDLPEFGDAEDFSIDELTDNNSPTQDNQVAAGNEIAFDLPEFGDAEDFSIDELTDNNSLTQDNQVAAGNEIAFDLPEFGDAEDFSIDELTDNNSLTQDNQVAAGNEIPFDLSEFGVEENLEEDIPADKNTQATVLEFSGKRRRKHR